MRGSGAFDAENSDVTSWHELLHWFVPFCTEFRKATKRFRMDPNSLKRTIHQFRVQWGGSGAFVANNFDATSWHESTSSAHFAPSFVRQQNGPECTQIVRNTPKRLFRVNGVDRVRSLQKIPMRLHGMNICTSLARFAPSFVRQPNGPECTQIVQKCTKTSV